MNTTRLAIAIAVLLGSVAAAQLPATSEPPAAEVGPHGVELGLRLGFALALGNSANGAALNEVTPGNVPLQLDLGYRINPRWFAGAYFQYGLAFIRDCADGGSCSGSDLRFGLEGQFHFIPRGDAFDPWVGLGAGYEIFHTSASGPQGSNRYDTKGLELANLSLGGDFHLSPSFAAGPVAAVSLGRYAQVGGDSIADQGTHFWLSLGVRGVFDLL